MIHISKKGSKKIKFFSKKQKKKNRRSPRLWKKKKKKKKSQNAFNYIYKLIIINGFPNSLLLLRFLEWYLHPI